MGAGELWAAGKGGPNEGSFFARREVGPHQNGKVTDAAPICTTWVNRTGVQALVCRFVSGFGFVFVRQIFVSHAFFQLMEFLIDNVPLGELMELSGPPCSMRARMRPANLAPLRRGFFRRRAEPGTARQVCLQPGWITVCFT